MMYECVSDTEDDPKCPTRFATDPTLGWLILLILLCCVMFAAVHGAETPIARQPAHALYYPSNTLGQGE